MLELEGKTAKDRKKNLEAFLEGKRIAVLVYGATWCGPCKAFERSVHKLEADTGLPVLHVDVDACEELCEAIESVPTTALYVDGEHVAFLRGAVGAKELRSWVADQLKGKGVE